MTSIAWLVATVLVYEALRRVYAVRPRIYTLPVLVTTVLIVAVILAFRLDLAPYADGTGALLWLLGPSTVALAVPLVRERALLARHARAVLIGVGAGAFVGLVSAVLLARAIHLPEIVVRSVAPKSVTTPVAMPVAASLGGNPEIAAVIVVVTGMFGMAFGPAILRAARVRTKLARGIALGTAAHGIGTAAAMSEDPTTGAASAVAMVIAAVMTALFASPLVWLVEW